MHFDPLLSVVLVGQVLLILVVGLVLFLRRHRRRDSTRPETDLSVEVSSGDAVDASSADSPAEASPTPVEDWTELVPPWADELESDLSNAFERRIGEVEEGLETRIDGVEDTFLTALEGIEDEVDAGFTEVDERLSSVSKQNEDERRRRERLRAQMEEVQSRLDAKANGKVSGAESANGNGSRPRLVDPAESGEEAPARVQDTLARARRNLFRASRTNS